jgi:methylthioribose-1-phosphate isomerase
MALAARRPESADRQAMAERVKEAGMLLASTRPTAVNLFWAIRRMEGVLSNEMRLQSSPKKIRERLLEEAASILEEERLIDRKIGLNGAALLPDPAVVLTHCNAGALATAGSGTALGIVYAAVETGKRVRVFADETRPLLQGARLTAWELDNAGVEITVICDSAAAALMKAKKVDCVLVGADRIARNGDTANKIGTYGLALLAKSHQIPFYVAAPFSSFDFSLLSGDEIPIEYRSREEIASGFGKKTVPDGAAVWNPAFDVTPHDLVTAYVTERGVMSPPFESP